MSTRGRESNMKEKRGKSPSLSRKSETGQQRRSPNPPSTLERKKASASTDTKNVASYLKPTSSSNLDPSSTNVKKQPSVDKNKPPRRSLDKPAPPSKVTSTRSKSNERNAVGSSSVSTKTTSLAKSKDVGNSHPPPRSLQPKNSVNVKKDNMNVSGTKQSRQPTKDLRSNAMAAEKKLNMSDAPKPDFSSSEEDHSIIIHEEDDKNMPAADGDILVFEDDDKQHLDNEDDDLLHGLVEFEDGGETHLGEPSESVALGGDQDMPESEICSQDNVTIDGSVDNEHTNDQDSEINQQDQSEEASDVASDFPDPNVDGENQELEKEVVETENAEEAALASKDVEHTDSAQSSILEAEAKDQENKEIKPKEREVEEGAAEVPKVEDPASKMAVKNQQGAAHGKKDTAAYNDVIEETASKLREQRRNKVRALVGAFETVISLESDAPQE